MNSVFYLILLIAISVSVVFWPEIKRAIVGRARTGDGRMSFGQDKKINVTFYGISTILFDDGRTQVMIDGFFSRPSLFKLFFGFSSNGSLLKKLKVREKLDRLAVIVAAHSHHDHAMDTAPLADCTGAKVLGSRSTANIAQGWGVCRREIIDVNKYMAEEIKFTAGPYRFGDFLVTLIPAKHSRYSSCDRVNNIANSVLGIGKRVSKPVRKGAASKIYTLDYFKEGVTYSIYLQHEAKSFLIHASAGLPEFPLNKYKADVVFLGVGGLKPDPNKANGFLDAYLKDVAMAVSAKLVIPIHWDTFTGPAGGRLFTELLFQADLDSIVQRMQEIFDKRLGKETVEVKVLKPKPVT